MLFKRSLSLRACLTFCPIAENILSRSANCDGIFALYGARICQLGNIDYYLYMTLFLSWTCTLPGVVWLLPLPWFLLPASSSHIITSACMVKYHFGAESLMELVSVACYLVTGYFHEGWSSCFILIAAAAKRIFTVTTELQCKDFFVFSHVCPLPFLMGYLL